MASAGGLLYLPPGVLRSALIAFALLPPIRAIHERWSPDIKQMQRRAFGWHTDDTVAIYGSNEWKSLADGSIYTPPGHGLSPAPVFSYQGLLKVAAAQPHLEICDRPHDNPTEITGNTLLVGGTRVTPYFDRFLEMQDNRPFRWVNHADVPEEFRPNSPPVRITRYFRNDTGVYSRTSDTGRYLIDARDSGRPPFGPFVNTEGRITSDVLCVTVGRADDAHKVVAANAGYGAVDCLAESIFDGVNLERMCRVIPDFRPPRFQAVFTVRVQHDLDGEVYSEPNLVDVVAF